MNCPDCKAVLPTKENLWEHIASDPVTCTVCNSKWAVVWQEVWDEETGEEYGWFELEPA